MPSILITGVSTGIGRATAELFRDRGWSVVGTVRDPAACAKGAPCPDGVALGALDLALPGSASRLAETVLARYGCPDVLVNNAGVLQFGPLETIADDELQRLFQVNVFGHVELIRALLPAMRERRSGTIVNVTSLGGRLTFPFFSGYNATKWAMEGVSEGLWHELQPFGIRVKAIEPGFVETAIWGKALPKEGAGVEGPVAYRGYLEAMARYEAAIKKRTPPADAAEEVFAAINDTGDRLRYPVAAYARALVAARRAVGDQRFMRFFHRRWMSHRGQP